MDYRGVPMYCSDIEPGSCFVVMDRIGTRYFANQAAAEAFVDAVLQQDDDGYPD